MKIASGMIVGTLTMIISGVPTTSFAEEYFCISTQGKPKHCNQGDILLVKPTMVPRVCDFERQILRMPKNEKAAEYLCRYTGTILGVKELKSRTPVVPNQPNNMRQPPPRKNNKMFDNMPFFK